MNFPATTKPICVLITEPEYRKAASVFNAADAREFLCRAAPSAELALADAVRESGALAVVLGTDRYSGPLYEALSPGGIIARFGVGFDGIDLAQATARGILCTNTPGVLDLSVAEHTMGLMLAAARHIAQTNHTMRVGLWAPRVGIELSGRRLAIIGCGAIGRRVASIASRGFGMEVIGCDRSVSGDYPEIDEPFRRRVPTFEQAVDGADFVSLHIPSIPANRHFINAARLNAMKPGAWLINTSRGPIVDEQTLFDLLMDGHLGGAALDVFEHEPYRPVDPDRDLRRLENVILTPHVGSSTAEACRRMAERVLMNIHHATRSQLDQMDLLNPDVASAHPPPPCLR
ncbi:MAG TPA: NAD(P)-dependent oxidoreductase [Kiritimatiellia bacterium]|nr:NAD(P)-dependent oxidoreductase [Kiritimatiellia bacterium]